MRVIHLLVLFGFLFSTSGKGYANRPKPTWQTGHLILTDGTRLSGDLDYNWQAETVLLREPDGRIRAFSATQVEQFSWQASPNQRARLFVTLPGSIRQMPTSLSFFEVCAEGPLTVVRRMKRTHGLFRRAYNNPIRNFDPETPDPHDSFFDYFAHVDGQFLSFKRFYVDIYLTRMAAYRQELQQFVQTRHLNEKSQFGQLRIIEQYNRLVERQTASVRTSISY